MENYKIFINKNNMANITLNFPKEGGERKFIYSLDCEEGQGSVTYDIDPSSASTWLSYTSANTKITVSAQTNTSMAARNAMLKSKVNNEECTNKHVEIKQDSNYLTLNIEVGGTLGFKGKPMQYSKDNGATWINVAADGTFNVSARDKILVKGTNTPSMMSPGCGQFSALTTSSVRFSVGGDPRSLIYGDATPPSSVNDFAYYGLFNGCTCVTNAENMVISKISSYSCVDMFKGCTNLVKGPQLKATALTTHCYETMFSGCTNLNEITCYAESGIDTNLSTTNWVSGVASNGRFYYKSGVTWPSGVNGVPTGWTQVTL